MCFISMGWIFKIFFCNCPFPLSPALSAYDDSWSIQVSPEVRTIEGYPAVLPCSFTHPTHTQHSSMKVVWRLGHARASTVLFRCSSLNGSQQCETGPDQDQRYRLEGNHREHDLSLRISSTGLQDNGRYYCGVELPDQPHANYENKMGTRLRVEGNKNSWHVLIEIYSLYILTNIKIRQLFRKALALVLLKLNQR